jgi:hypothetical protein
MLLIGEGLSMCVVRGEWSLLVALLIHNWALGVLDLLHHLMMLL